jgi:hypothetical protein
MFKITKNAYENYISSARFGLRLGGVALAMFSM